MYMKKFIPNLWVEKAGLPAAQGRAQAIIESCKIKMSNQQTQKNQSMQADWMWRLFKVTRLQVKYAKDLQGGASCSWF